MHLTVGAFARFSVSLLFLIISCKTDQTQRSQENLAEESLDLPTRPNILWLVTEDMGPYIPPFGDSTVATPNLSRLAREGVIYPNLYSTSGVCAPSRAAIATGMYPSGIGANNMRVNSYTEVTGLPAYEAIPPPEAKMISEWLRLDGYYCTNNYKEDYQFDAPVTAWDKSSTYAHWRKREEGQPFFAVFNFTDTHESGLFEPYGFRNLEARHYHEGDTSFKWQSDRMSVEETTVHLPKDTPFNIPPYLPDTPVVRNDLWKMYNNIAEMDQQIGAVLNQLEEDGLLESTIIFFYGDHGGPLPREKRLIYDTGLNTPLIIRFPKKKQAGSKNTQLLSFVDFAPTLLSLTGEKPKAYMDGQAFLGRYKAEKEREYIHAAADRFDGFTDVIRAVRDDRYKYIRNYRPEQGYYLPIVYREQIPSMQELLRLRNAGTLNEVQMQWFRKSKPEIEFFDCLADPYELNNLAEDQQYAEKIDEFSLEMDRWLREIGDQPGKAENQLIKDLWDGENGQPHTKAPDAKLVGDAVHLDCATEGASLGYKILDENGTSPKSWSIYNAPFELKAGSKIEFLANRIGFKPSEVKTFKMPDHF
ncbi:MAG: sulfatase-like hydrolase/transferase [Leeuwenhoekiella sp.]